MFAEIELAVNVDSQEFRRTGAWYIIVFTGNGVNNQTIVSSVGDSKIYRLCSIDEHVVYVTPVGDVIYTKLHIIRGTRGDRSPHS